MPDESDAYLTDWPALWRSVPEAVREQVRNRWKTVPPRPGTVDVQDWRILWNAAPQELKEELRSKWHDQQHLPFEGQRPITAAELREIINENKASLLTWKPSQWILTLFFIWILLLAAADVWQSHLRYVVWYGTEWGGVTIENKPHDCDFLAAPLGEKNCEYEAQVQVQKTSMDKNSGRPVISYDGGKTWDYNDGPNAVKGGTQVHVGWQKVNE